MFALFLFYIFFAMGRSEQYCELTGVWVYETNTTMKINFVKKSASEYRVVCLSSIGCPVPYDWYGIGISVQNNKVGARLISISFLTLDSKFY